MTSTTSSAQGIVRPASSAETTRPPRREEQAVLVSFGMGGHHHPLRDDDPAVLALGDGVERAIQTHRLGVLDGFQTGPDSLTLLAYSEDAERLWRCVEPEIRRFAQRPVEVVLRYGLFGARERTLRF